MIKVVSLTLAILIGVGVLAGIGILTGKTVHYMTVQHFPVGEAISWAWQDTIGMIPFVNSRAETEPYVVYGPTNLHVDVIGLGV